MKEKNKLWLFLFAITVVFTFYTLSTGKLMDPDTWWHMSSGREIVKNTGLPGADTFSYAVESHKWYSHEWLFDIFTST